MKIGIIGAENSHTAAIAKLINVQKKIKGFTVDYVWGETREFAEKAAEAGAIPNIVRKPGDMLGKIDAVVVDHRHGKYHLAAVRPFVEEGLPTFVDKPFCYRSAEGKEFLKMARRKGTPVTSFSVLPHQKSFERFKKKIRDLGPLLAGATYGPADLRSKYGGVFFYGIHQVDLALQTFGYDVKSARIVRNGPNATGQLLYRSGAIVTLNFIKEGTREFVVTAIGEKGDAGAPMTRDADPYLTGVKCFTRMFKTGEEPFSHEEILKPVQVLEALERSLKSDKVEKVV